MSCLKETVERFLYPHIEHFVNKIYEGGENTVIDGINVLDEDSAFTHGALIHATSILYVHYENEGDGRAADILKKLDSFIDILLSKPYVRTWGKLATLRGLYKLKKSGLLKNIPQNKLNRINKITDYSDFLNKDTIELIDLPTNYFQVALACAAYREALGFECDGISNKIETRFTNIAFAEKDSFMDDEPGFGRYDRYSFILSSEISDLYRDLNRELPLNIIENLKCCSDFALFMSNSIGDGFNYGRSLSTHGDLAPVEVLSSALSRNLISERHKPLALSYIFAVLQKLFYFWYNGRKESFDIWCNGRTTNGYRQIHRLLEVNMDLACHVFTLYDNIRSCGLENIQVLANMPYPKKWEFKRFDFDSVHKAYALRYGDTLSMLPFVGTKKLALNTSYNPLPSICGMIEPSPESTLPFLIPEYTDSDGNKYRPSHFVYKTEERVTEDETLVITAYGKLMRTDNAGEASDIDYRQDLYFQKNEITVEFEVDAVFISAEMMTATANGASKIYVGGFSKLKEPDISDTDDFKTPHGAYTEAYLHTSETPSRVGYKVILNI